MKKIIISALVVFLLISILIGCSNVFVPDNRKDAVTIIDATGAVVEVPYPVERIVSMNSGLSTLIAAFGEGDKIVGRDTFSTFPSSLINVYAVGKNSAHPSIELIFDQKPDIVVADTMLHESVREKIEAAGIPVIVESTSDPDRIFFIVRNFGLILDKKEKAEEIIEYMESYLNIVYERIAELESEEESFPLIYFENRHDYKSASGESPNHKPIASAGGVNIAVGEPVPSPRLSSEWILERDPDIIVRRMSGDAGLEDMKAMREGIITRLGLKNTKAVKEGNVYIIKADILLTIRYPVGLLYYAKWFHPYKFSDIEPSDVHKELVDKFFGEEEWDKIKEVFVYPEYQ